MDNISIALALETYQSGISVANLRIAEDLLRTGMSDVEDYRLETLPEGFVAVFHGFDHLVSFYKIAEEEVLIAGYDKSDESLKIQSLLHHIVPSIMLTFHMLDAHYDEKMFKPLDNPKLLEKLRQRWIDVKNER